MSVRSPDGDRSSMTLNQTPRNSSARPCVVCGQTHRLFNCDAFKAMKPRERFEIAFKHRLCYNCLLGGHLAHECRKPSTCSVQGCAMKHRKFIHIDKSDDSQVNGTSMVGEFCSVSLIGVFPATPPPILASSDYR